MKNIKFIIAILMILSINKTVFPYKIALSQPNMCVSAPFALVYPESVMKVEFIVEKNLPTDEDYYRYEIYAEQHGASVLLYQYTGLVDEFRSDPINLSGFPAIRYNEIMTIKIKVRPYNLNIYQQAKGYLVYYKNGPGYNFRAVTNGQSQLQTIGQSMFFNYNGCPFLPNSQYFSDRYKVWFALNGHFNLNDSLPQIVDSLCAGYTIDNFPNYHIRWGQIESMNQNQIIFSTYVYDLTNIAGHYYGFLPATCSTAAITYVWARRPVIDSIGQYPKPFRLYTVGMIYNHARNINSVTNYSWIDSFNVHQFGFEPHDRYALVNYDHLPSGNLAVPPMKVYTKAFNNYFSSGWKFIEPTFAGGYNYCPWVTFDISGKEILDNSILNQSSYSENEIEDNLILGNPMLPDADTIKFKIAEKGDSKTKIDKLQLLQVNVNPNEGIGVTADGNIVNYNKNSLIKPKLLLNSYEDVSDILFSEDNSEITFNKGDRLEIYFPIKDEGYLIFSDYINLTKEKAAGVLENQKGEIINVFSRSNKSISCIKIEPEISNHLTYTCEQEYVVDMIAFVRNLKSAEINELPLLEASLSGKNNIESILKNNDGNYLTLTPDLELSMSFLNLPAENKNTFYILNSIGRIINSAGRKMENNSGENSKYEFRLFENNPNPFNPVTKIQFEIPENGHAKLSVFDLTGRKVNTLLDAFTNAGMHKLTFDGSGLASGIYFYRLEFNGRISTKKMLLIK